MTTNKKEVDEQSDANREIVGSATSDPVSDNKRQSVAQAPAKTGTLKVVAVVAAIFVIWFAGMAISGRGFFGSQVQKWMQPNLAQAEVDIAASLSESKYIRVNLSWDEDNRIHATILLPKGTTANQYHSRMEQWVKTTVKARVDNYAPEAEVYFTRQLY